MTILGEIKEFLRSISYSICIFFILSAVVFSFPVGYSYTVIVFNILQDSLLPEGVSLVVTNYLSAFVAQVVLSMLISFVVTFPIFLFNILRYLTPALRAHEKNLLLKAVIPSSLLFFCGCLFSYFFIIPFSFNILFSYASVISAQKFFDASQFISSVFSLMFAVGIMFLLPVFMVLLSFFRIVNRQFWLDKWRHTVLFFLIFSAIITPDGTGVTMIMLFVPLLFLYGLGYFFSKK
jgi:sec-independent protein translocase protein TatC